MTQPSWEPPPLVPGYATGLVFHKNGSAWEKVSVNGEWVAQIHHERGARDWDIHFREAIPWETYPTRKAAVAALKARFTPDEEDTNE